MSTLVGPGRLRGDGGSDSYPVDVPRTSAPRPSSAIVIGGRYELRGLVGRGGMADVHRAHDRRLGREVAVKVLHRHLAADPTFLERFRREAIAAAALSHPNVVAVHDWGEGPDGAWLVLQLVEGPSLRDVLRRTERLTVRQALAVLGPAAAGLGAAHASGLVHRDVKPENILIGHDGIVRITDFGLARASASSTSTFGTGVVVGSPHYLAPEAVLGGPIDPRADVYGLGIVLFECLTGGPPHHGDSPLATAMAHTTNDVPPPSRFVAGLASAIDELVRWSTDRRPEARYDDAAAFGWALTAAVAEGPDPIPATTLAAAAADRAATLPTPERIAGPDDDAADPDGPDHAGRGGPFDDHTVLVATDGDGIDRPTHRLDPLEVETTVLPTRRRRGRRLLALVALVAAMAGGSTLVGADTIEVLGERLAGLRALVAGTTTVEVPDTTGLPLGAARARLDVLDVEVVVAPERLHDREVPAGHVLAQDPIGAVRSGSTVSLVVSAGPRPVVVPEAGSTDPDAVAVILGAEGFVAGRASRHDERVPEGEVIALEPPAGTTLDEGATVRIVVSLGPPPVEVPTLVGLALGRASEVLRELGLELDVSSRRFDASAPGTVLVQTQAAGTTVPRGTVVTVIVSDGPAPVEVPNLRGRTVGEAVETLTALGLEVEVIRRGGPAAALTPDRVYDQDPGPGRTLRPGETVILWAYDA